MMISLSMDKDYFSPNGLKNGRGPEMCLPSKLIGCKKKQLVFLPTKSAEDAYFCETFPTLKLNFCIEKKKIAPSILFFHTDKFFFQNECVAFARTEFLYFVKLFIN